MKYHYESCNKYLAKDFIQPKESHKQALHAVQCINVACCKAVWLWPQTLNQNHSEGTIPGIHMSAGIRIYTALSFVPDLNPCGRTAMHAAALPLSKFLALNWSLHLLILCPSLTSGQADSLQAVIFSLARLRGSSQNYNENLHTWSTCRTHLCKYNKDKKGTKVSLAPGHTLKQLTADTILPFFWRSHTLDCPESLDS